MNSELNVDFSGILQEADRFDKKLVSMADHARDLGSALQDALGRFNLGGLRDLTNYVERLSNTSVNLIVDDKGTISKISSEMDKIVSTMDLISRGGGEIFDAESLHTSNNKILESSQRLDELYDRIEKIKEEWKNVNKNEGIKDADLARGFEVPTYKSGKNVGQEAKVHSETYKNAAKEYLEFQLRLTMNEKEGARERLNWAMMTEDQKTVHLKKETEKKIKEEQRYTKQVQQEYEKTMREIVALTKSHDSLLNKQSKQGIDLSPQISDIEKRFSELNERKKTLENDYGQYVVDLAKKYNAQIQEIYAKRIEENAKAEKKSREEYLKTPSGALLESELALDYGNKARLEQAKKHLKEASGKITEQEYDAETLQKLRDAYQKVTAAIERLNLVQKDETTLQPTLRNEYSRLLKELTKLEDAQSRLSNTKSFLKQDSSAVAAYDEIEARIEDIKKKMSEIEQAANPHLNQIDELKQKYQEAIDEFYRYDKIIKDAHEKGEDPGPEVYKKRIDANDKVGNIHDEIEALEAKESILDEIKRKHAAENAVREVAETEKVEKQKAEIVKQRLKEQLAENSKYGNISADSAKRLVDVTDKASNLSQHEAAISKLKDAVNHLDQSSADYGKTLDLLNHKIRAHEEAIKIARMTEQEYDKYIEDKHRKREQEAKKQKDAQWVDTAKRDPNAILNFSKTGTNSINDQLRAIELLKIARDNLDKSTYSGNYEKKVEELTNEIKRQQSEVDKLRGKQENLNKTKKSLMNTADQLQRKLALLFSVSAIQGYVDKLVSIRGEFEMQTRSLEVLLQNKKEANKLWNQTVELAVKSPFTVKQLATYTKQLAAYRIENDKLFETNKMLADVSAGLGVDMQRLILAFGQVKAANFLRGTELRQFSEAGVNMLDELSNILSEVEGRVISVGDVFEMISNRQISFEHVEEVFKRITAPGGLFYQMQEKQSETTKGMMLNFHDSVELMMNDIGISYDSVIKGGIGALKTLVDNWRTIAPILKTVVLSFGFNLIRKGFLSLGPIFSTAGTAVAGFFKTFKTAMLGAQMQMAAGTSAVKAYAGVLRSLSSISFSGWLSIITIMGMVVTAIYQAVTATDKLGEELNRIDQDLSKQLTDNIALYKELADKVNDVTASEYDRNQALDEMKRAFKDILPDEMLRAETIASYGENYKEAEKAMRSYYNSEKLMQQTSKIQESYQDKIDSLVQSYAPKLDFSFGFEINKNFEKNERKKLTDSYMRVLNGVIRDIRSGKLDASTTNIQEEFTKRLSAFTEIDSSRIEKVFGDSPKEYFRDLQNILQEEASKISDIQPLLGTTWSSEQNEKAVAQIQQQVELVKQAYSTISNLASQKASGKVDYWREILPNIQQALTEVQQNAPIYYEALNNVWKELEKNANKGVFEFNSSIQKLGDGFNETIAGIIEKQNKGNAAAINFAEGLKEALDDKQLSQSGQAVVQIFEEVAASMELDPDVFAKFIPTAQQSLADIRTMIEGEISNIQDQIRRMNTSMASGVSGVLMNWLFFLKEGETPEQKIAKLNKLLKAYDTALSKLGGPKSAPKTKTPKAKKDKIPKTTTKKTDDPAEALADYLEEAYDRFLEFNEEMSETAANNKIFEIYGKEFETLEEKVKGLDLKLPLFKQGDEKPYLDALDKIKEKARTETKKQITDDARDATADTFLENKKEENEATKEQVDLLFEEYEIYKELEKIGMSPAMAKGLFGISTTSLNDITQKLQELKNAGKFEGTNMAEAYEEYSQKIKDEETKQQQDRLKIYTEYAKKSVGERAKIELEYLNHMAEIEKATVGRGTEKDSDGHLQSVYDNATAKAIEERNAALQKLEWEEFQKSDMFLMLFEDLDGASEQLMQHTLDQLKNFKEQWADMPLEDVKAITDKINDLESALINLKNPWKAIKTINQNIDSITNGKSRKQVYDEAMFAQTEMNRNNEEIAQLQVIRDLMWNGKEIAKEQRDLILAFSPAWDGTIEALDAIILRKNNMNKGYMRTIGLARKLTQQEKDAIKTYNRQEDAYNEINSLAKKLYDASKELVELFVDEDSLVTVFADMGMNMASTVLDTLALQANIDATRVSLQAAQVEAQAFGLAMNYAAGIVGWIVMGIQLLSQVLSAIFNAHDKAKQKEIDKEIENVEKLEKALEDLEERLEKVYSMGQLNSAMRQTQTNIDKQIQSYEKMIHLEEEKKKTDKDQIKDWQESIEELREKRLELHKEMVESLGGDYDIRSVARDFVDAWIDAFKETGDGLKGLRENFKEFFLNILLEQAVMKKVGGLFGDAMNYLNDVVLSDYIVTDAERKKTEGMFDAAMIKTNDYLNMLFGENGVLNKYIDDTDSTLSGLQQGVQGVTEETAQIIEAYLNSIRFFIAQDNQNLAKLTDAFTNVDTPSPILSELRNQTELITTIKDALNSVIKTGGHTEGGAYIKVAL